MVKPSIKKWLKWLQEKLVIKDYISFDLESTGLDIYKDKIHFITWDHNGKEGYAIIRPDLCKDWRKVIPKEIVKALEDRTTTVIIHSSQFDAPMFRLKTGIHIRKIWDTAITELVLLGGLYEESMWSDIALAKCLDVRFGIKMNKEERLRFIDYEGPITEKQLKYGLKDIRYLKKLAFEQLKQAKEDKLEQVVKLENLTCEVTAELRYNGIGFDEQFWMDLAEENTKIYQQRIAKLPKAVKNWNSEKQVKAYFLEVHDIEIGSYKELKTINVKNKVLEQFKEARELYNAVSTFGYSFLKRKHKHRKQQYWTIDPDGRIRCSYNQIMETGRYSTNDPNLQNQPAKGKHRHAFVPRPGFRFVNGDFTGQELGAIAAGSKDPIWVEAMKKGHDIHSVMATKVYPEWEDIGDRGCGYPFKCDCKEHKGRRRKIKDLNFGLAYGQGVEAFCVKNGIPLKEGYSIVKKYKKSIPKVVQWLEGNGKFAIRHGWIRTLAPFFRIRYVQGEDWKKKNRGKNSPVQGSGADMMKLAMCMIYDYIYEENIQDIVKMVLTVHDELLTECKTKYTKEWAKIMKYFMEEAAMFITKDKLITTEPEIMDKWEIKS
jgi:DNA polymerase-1